MSIRTLSLAAAMIAGMLGFASKADAQVIVGSSGVVYPATTSYYYSYPSGGVIVSSGYSTPVYGTSYYGSGYYSMPYSYSYPYTYPYVPTYSFPYTSSYPAYYGRRWWRY
jgi:hypothetical protein